MERRSIVWVDSGGFTRQTQVTGNATLATVQADLLALSNGALSAEWEGTLTVAASPAPVTAQFQSVLDYALLTFVTSAGTLVTIALPAPVVSIFMADQQTVDPAMIGALIADVTGVVTDNAGNAVTAYVSGVRRRLGS